MKKFFSLIAAVLFAGSMMAADATMTAGTNASACTVNDVDGIKCGTSKAGGDMTITVGAGATKLTFYAGAWNNVNDLSLNITAPDGVTVNPASVALEMNTGLSNNSPFTLAGEEASYKHEVVLSGVEAETTLTLAGSTTKRFVVWNATYETEGGDPAPADTYTVAGSDAAIFGEAWNPALAANDMVRKNGVYTWEKDGLNLTAGTIQFKVVKNHSWDVASYPAQNYEVSIAEEGEYTITITFDPATEAVAAEAVKKEPLADPTDCATAAAAALSVSANNELFNDGATYSINGYVTGIKTAYNDQYHNISFWMADAADGGEVLQAYRAACATEADAPVVGDFVTVTGTLTKYGSTPEFSAGCTFEIIEHATPVEVEEYYLTGSIREWAATADEDLHFVLNEAAEGVEYILRGIALPAGAEIKVIGIYQEAVAWYPAGMENNLVIALDSVYDIYFRPNADGDEAWHEGCIYVVGAPVVVVPTTCAEAREAILALEDNAFLLDQAEITLQGYVTEIATVYSDQYHNISFWIADAADGGQVIQAFRAACASEADAPAVGDLVRVVGKMKKYVKNGVATPEFDAGCTFEIIPETAIENTNAAVKAVKVIREGQLFIEKNGVLYNAQGAVVR